MHTIFVLFTVKFRVSLSKSKFFIEVIINYHSLLYQLAPKLKFASLTLYSYLIAQQVTVDNVSLYDQNFS